MLHVVGVVSSGPLRSASGARVHLIWTASRFTTRCAVDTCTARTYVREPSIVCGLCGAIWADPGDDRIVHSNDARTEHNIIGLGDPIDGRQSAGDRPGASYRRRRRRRQWRRRTRDEETIVHGAVSPTISSERLCGPKALVTDAQFTCPTVYPPNCASELARLRSRMEPSGTASVIAQLGVVLFGI